MTENAAYIVLSRQMAIRRQMDTIANNIANMNTTSFKTQRILFEEFLMDTDDGGKMAYVRDFGSVRDLQQGELRSTLNPLDIAIDGPGYFQVETADGERYTRNGHFRSDAEGFLVTPGGDKLLSERGTVIRLDPADPQFNVSRDGTVSNSQGPLGKLAIVTFENEQNMIPVGGGLYKTDDPAEPVEEVRLVQGMIESSNVEPIMEMTRMIQASRAYESTRSMMKKDDDVRQQAISRLGRVE